MAVPTITTEPVGPPCAVAEAANAPAGLNGKLEIIIPSLGKARLRPVGWVPKVKEEGGVVKPALPKAGDTCLVAYDDNGEPWVVAWAN